MTVKRRDIFILIAHANAFAGELLAGALNRHLCFRVAARATTAHEVVEAVRSLDLDVALINATLADGPLSGFRALRQMRECSPEVKTVVLLDCPEPNLIVDAFWAGAKGVFCPSQSTFKTLCRCVDCVDAGSSGRIAANCPT